jgi:hypothetical protein
MKFHFTLFLWLAAASAPGCELCAIYNAGASTGESSSGFLFSVAEQYIPYETSQFEGQVVTLKHPSYVDSSITHLVPGYNFCKYFGLSFNVPVENLNFRRTDLRYSLTAPPEIFTEKGTITGVGDAALIGRLTVFQRTTMQYGIVVNLLGGIKFPTGDADRLNDEVAQTRLFDSFLPPGTPHDPLGHSISSVHEHMLALGSGSYDEIFGATLNARWRSWLFNAQLQCEFRQQGSTKFRYGDEMMISGGPATFLFLEESWNLTLQVNAVYDKMERDRILNRLSNRTGMTAWYIGPQVALSLGQHFSANAGIDVPLSIDNGGFQSVPNYRLHGGFSLRF